VIAMKSIKSAFSFAPGKAPNHAQSKLFVLNDSGVVGWWLMVMKALSLLVCSLHFLRFEVLMIAGGA
jgi:hypothetical protein